MATTVDEKTPILETQVQGNLEDRRQDRDTRHWVRRTIFRKVIAFVGCWFILGWLFHAGWLGRGSNKFTDVSDGRKRWINAGFQSLQGEFDLYDLLSINSTAGSLKLLINPKPADEQNPVPAQLLISSLAGQVSVDFPAIDAPNRDYRVSIDSHHGSINGHILHGRMTSITSKTASIVVELTPYSADDYASTIHTSSKIGEHKVSVLSPAEPGASIKEMSSMHSTGTGSLVLHYPKEWEGTIEGDTKVGSLNLHGDLEIIRQESSHTVGRYILAKKGKGNSTLNFHVGIGSVDVYFD
jgi:hypothetical protein